MFFAFSGEIGGVPILFNKEEDENNATAPEDEDVDNFHHLSSVASRIPPAQVLLADRVRRKLNIIHTRPKLRNRILKMSKTNEQKPLKAGTKRNSRRSGNRPPAKTMSMGGKYMVVDTGGLTTTELRSLMVQHTGTTFDVSEWKWLCSRLDPKKTGRIWAEDLVSLLDLNNSKKRNNGDNGDTSNAVGTSLLYYNAEDEEKEKQKRIKGIHQKNKRRKKNDERKNDEEEGHEQEEEVEEEDNESYIARLGTEAELDFLPDVKRRRRKHTRRELEQIALLEEELLELLDQNDREFLKNFEKLQN